MWENLIVRGDPGASDGWMARFDADHGNVRAALAWLDETRNDEALTRLAGALWRYWHLRSHRREGWEWMGRALARSRGSGSTARARALHAAGMAERSRGDYARATAMAAEALAIWKQHDDPWGEAVGLELLGYIASAEGAYGPAAAQAEHALTLFEALGNDFWIDTTLVDLTLAHWGLGDLQRTTVMLDQASARFRARGSRFNVAIFDGYRGLIAVERGDFAAAAGRFTASWPFWEETGHQENIAEWLAGVAALGAAMRRSERAARLMGAATALRDRLGHAFVLPERSSFDRAEQALRRDLDAAAFATADAAGRSMPLEQAIAEAVVMLTDAAAWEAPRTEPLTHGLTVREQEVVTLLCAHLTAPEIAEKLFISERTVETHVANIYAKLGVATRREALVAAARLGLA
jgi:DNA-binding CsgD family transcriptional regulator